MAKKVSLVITDDLDGSPGAVSGDGEAGCVEPERGGHAPGGDMAPPSGASAIWRRRRPVPVGSDQFLPTNDAGRDRRGGRVEEQRAGRQPERDRVDRGTEPSLACGLLDLLHAGQ